MITFAKNSKVMNSWLSILIDRATSQGYKSNVLRPIISIVAVILACSIYYCYVDAFLLALIALAIVAVFAVVFIGVFIYCIIKKPDLLRSERYNLQIKAMEQNISSSGNSVKGEHSDEKNPSTKNNSRFIFFTSGVDSKTKKEESGTNNAETEKKKEESK